VLLIDSDPQGNATSGLGIDKAIIKKTIYESIIGLAPIREVIFPTGIVGLDIVPASINLTGAMVELVYLEDKENRLSLAIAGLDEQYDFIIIDCPPSLGLLTINILVAVREIIIPLQCEYYALEGLSQLLNIVNIVKANLNPSLNIAGILLTMADMRTNLTQQVIREVQQYFKDKVFGAIIPRNVRLGEAPSFGQPIIQYDVRSTGAEAYVEFTKEVLNG
jgi:chromosome partitioning protein